MQKRSVHLTISVAGNMSGSIYFSVVLSIQIALVSCGQLTGNSTNVDLNRSAFFDYAAYNNCQDSNPSITYFLTDDTACGGILTNTVGSITLPTPFAANYSCKWAICVEKGIYIRTELIWFQIRKHDGCEMEYLEVCDGCHYSEDGKLLNGDVAKFCEADASLANLLISTKGHVTIMYWSKKESTMNFVPPFRLNYQTGISTVFECSGTSVSESGLIASPAFESRPSQTIECVWELIVPIGQRIQLNFREFKIQNNFSFCEEYLQMIDGESLPYPSTKLFFRDSTPPVAITSNSNSVRLKYYSSQWCYEDMFRLQIQWHAVKTACNETFKSAAGIITSPSFPNKQLELFCWWKIYINPGNLIRYIFLHFESEVGYASDCGISYLQIMEIRSKTAYPLGIWCEDKNYPKAAETTTNSLMVILRSSPKHFENLSFRMQFETVCTHTLKGLHGIIESINFPETYPPNLKCIWTIESSTNGKVAINVTHLNLISDKWNDDLLEIVENTGRDTDEWNTVRKFTKDGHPHSFPHVVIAHGKFVKITFQSYNQIRTKGGVFRIAWKIEGCGKEIIGMEGTITSPNFPNEYPWNSHCKWIIVTNDNTKVVLSIDHWDIENSTDCRFDGLKIYNGPDDRSQLLAHLCGRGQFPVVLTSDLNQMFIEFFSDESNVEAGFHATFKGVARKNGNSCGGSFTGPSGYIYSPNYPNDYHTHLNCTWVINVNQNYNVALEFLDIDIEFHDHCEYDKIGITYNELDSETLVGPLCGKKVDVPDVIEFPVNNIEVRFESDLSQVRRGFKAKYFQICGATLHSESGAITSPEFMAMTNGAGNCSWTIKAKHTKSRVVLIFTNFLWPVPDQFCFKRNARIFDGHKSLCSNVSQLYIGCCNHLPPPIVSSRYSMTVQITNGEALQFQAFYFTIPEDCISALKEVSNGLTSTKDYVDDESEDSIQDLCSSVVNTKLGRISILVQPFLKDLHVNQCDTSFVEVLHSSVSEKLFGNYCRTEIPVLTAHSQQWIVRLDLGGQENNSFLENNANMQRNFNFDINVAKTPEHLYYFQWFYNFAKYIFVLICLILLVWITYKCIR